MTVTINGTTGVSGVDGSAGTPAVQGTDTNTGIVFPAADTVAIATGGTEQVRVNSSGYVGIGTSTINARLQVYATGASTASITTVSDFGAANVTSVGRVANNSAGVYLGQGDALTGTSGGIASGLGFLREATNWNSAIAFYTNNTTDGVTTNRITERARIDSSGNLLVGATSAGLTNTNSVTLQTNGPGGVLVANHSGTASGSAYAFFAYNGGSIGGITQNGTTAVAYNTSSDYRLKHDIAPMTRALAKVAALKPCTYKWNADGSDGEGFIAHELAEVVPQCVTGEKDAVDAEGKPVYQGIDTSFLVATLTAAIQELTARVQALETK